MARVRGQARVEHLLDLWAGFQELSHSLRIGTVAIHADFQGLDAAGGEIGVERRGHRTDVSLEIQQALIHLRGVGHDRTTQHIRVAAQVLRGGVQKVIRAQLQRVLQVGSGESVVDDNLDVASRLDCLSDRSDIRDRRRRIGRGLQPNELGVLLQRRLHRRGIGGVNDGQLDAPLTVVMVQETVHAAVGIVTQNHVVTWAHDDTDEGIDGRHARGETASILGIL